MLTISFKALSGIQRLSIKYWMPQNRKNKGKWPNKKNSQLSSGSFRLWHLHSFRQQPALELSSRYQLSHLLEPPQTFHLCSAWESHPPWDGGQWPPGLCRAHGVSELQRQNLSQQMGSPTVPGHALIQKSPFLLYCCSLEQWGRSTSAQITYHPLNKASTQGGMLLTAELKSRALF